MFLFIILVILFLEILSNFLFYFLFHFIIFFQYHHGEPEPVKRLYSFKNLP